MSRRRAPGVAEERVLLAPAAGDDAMLRSQKVKLDDDGELVELGAGDKKRDDDRGRAQEADVPVSAALPSSTLLVCSSHSSIRA
jgi:hypothetical protein